MQNTPWLAFFVFDTCGEEESVVSLDLDCCLISIAFVAFLFSGVCSGREERKISGSHQASSLPALRMSMILISVISSMA